MNPTELIKGKKYNYLDPALKINETVTYSYEQLNYYVFAGKGFDHYLPHNRVKSNINEIV